MLDFDGEGQAEDRTARRAAGETGAVGYVDGDGEVAGTSRWPTPTATARRYVKAYENVSLS
jgi:hypothetical protein